MSYCMVNSPHLLDDLILFNKGNVDGINDGLEILGKGEIQLHHCGRQQQAAHHSHSRLSMSIWVEEMPPITTTLVADGSRQKDMDGEV